MAAPIHVTKNYTTTGAKEWIPLNRWGEDDFLVNVALGTTGTFTLEGTISRVNRGETILAFDITGAVGLTASAGIVIKDTPLEAIRINIAAVGTDIDFQVMQQGSWT